MYRLAERLDATKKRKRGEGMKTIESNLKPCPFCGETPKIEETARFPRSGRNEGKRIKGYTIVCKNLDCILYNADDWYRSSLGKACAAWNRRIEIKEEAE